MLPLDEAATLSCRDGKVSMMLEQGDERLGNMKNSDDILRGTCWDQMLLSQRPSLTPVIDLRWSVQASYQLRKPKRRWTSALFPLILFTFDVEIEIPGLDMVA